MEIAERYMMNHFVDMEATFITSCHLKLLQRKLHNVLTTGVLLFYKFLELYVKSIFVLYTLSTFAAYCSNVTKTSGEINGT